MKKIKKIYCGGNHTIILKENGETWVFGRNFEGQLGIGSNKDQNKPVLMMIDEKIRKISCGNYHNFLLKNNGELFVWGDNKDG